MPLPPEVQKTLNAIDRKIRALEETKARLVETFGDSFSVQTQSNHNGNNGVTPPPRPIEAAVTLPSGSPVMLSSAERLLQFMRNHGPATRKEIIERSGVPDGSISYLLRNNPTRYRQRDDQKWEVIA